MKADLKVVNSVWTKVAGSAGLKAVLSVEKMVVLLVDSTVF